MLKPTIKSPCSEDWDKMKIGIRSRHCEKCALNVMDFTTRSRHEIIHFLFENQGKRICGRMHGNQMDFTIPELVAYVEAERRSPSWKNHYWKVVSLASLLLLSCQPGTGGEKVLGQIDLVVQDSAFQGDTAAIPVDSSEQGDTAKHCTPDANSNKTIPPPVEGMIEVVGEVAVDHPIPDTQWVDPNNTYPMGTVNQDSLDNLVYQFVDEMPSFGDGKDSTLFKYIRQNLHYPKEEKEAGIEGRVIVQFVVRKDGSLTDIEIVHTVQPNGNMNKAVLNLMQQFPSWNPGMKNGKPVHVQMRLPIFFRLNH